MVVIAGVRTKMEETYNTLRYVLPISEDVERV